MIAEPTERTQVAFTVGRWRDSVLSVGESLGPQFASAALYSLAGSVLSQVLNMIGMSVAAMVLGTDTFGKFAMVQNTTSLLGTLGAVGLGVTATSYVSRFRLQAPLRAANVIAASSVFASFFGLLLTIGLYVASPALAIRVLNDAGLSSTLRFAAMASLFHAIASAQTGSLAGFEAFRTIAIGNAFRGILSVAGVPLGAWFWGLNGAVTAYVISAALVCIFNEVLLRKECARSGLRPRLRNAIAEYRLFQAFSLPVFIGSIIVGPTTWIANAMLVKESGGFAELGIYAAAERWRMAVLFAPACLASVALPILSSSSLSPARFRSYLLNYGLVVVVLAAPPAAAVGLLATPIMSALGTGFASGGPTLKLMALASIAVAANTALGQALLSTQLAWLRLGIDVVLSLVFLVLCVWLIPVGHSAGMAGAFLASYVVAVGLLIAAVPYALRRAGSRGAE
ncbi:MAG TPA: oligosaccharide flippase family protein [Bryobacteraceae bacterium]|nr:oligosaccharide flippase family protein [Bryobacteraceae bacterium]